MSDNKKKPNGEKVNGEDTTSKGTSKGAKFADKLNKIFGLCSELKNDSAGAADYERTLEENIILKAKLQNCHDEVTSLKAETEKLNQTMKTNLGTFAKQYADYEAKLKDLASFQKDLKDSKERVQKLSDGMKNMEAENKQLKKKATDAETSRKRAEIKLADTERECQRTISFYGEDMLSEVDPEDLRTKLEGFADKCHNMAMTCFQTCEAPPQNTNPLEVRVSNRASSIPLSQSTSLPARLMRCAAAEFVIMNAIVDHVFTDIYFPGHIARQKAVSSTLALLASEDPQREAIIRCQLLSEFEADDDTKVSVTQAAFDDICTVVGSLLPAGPLRAQFHKELVGLLQSGLEIWTPLQSSKHRVFADFSTHGPILERDHDFYDDYDKTNNPNGAGRPSSPGSTGTNAVLLLFPQITMDGQIIVRATSLWSDQAALVEAREEASMAERGRLSLYGSSATRTEMARPRNQQRRQSMGGPLGGPRSPTAAASPTTGYSEGAGTKLGSLAPSRRGENGVKAGAGQKG